MKEKLKELSIEEKAKAYDENLIVAKQWYDDSDTTKKEKYLLKGMFPELAESEDERIRKYIIKYFEANKDELSEGFKWNGITVEECIAWLEKQGEIKEIIPEDATVDSNEDGLIAETIRYKNEKQGEQKSFARYKVGDTIYYNSFGKLVSFVIANIVEDGTDNPMYEDKDGNSVFQNDIVEHNPAENKGMNLVEEEMTPFQKKVFCIIDTTIEEEQGLKQVCDELLALASNEIKKNPAEWSEEDEKLWLDAKSLAYEVEDRNLAFWIMSLKDRVQPKTGVK